MSEATAIAHPNIALSKYWGKRPYEGNFPAVPSLSLTLDGLATRTRVAFGKFANDELLLNGEVVTGQPLLRVTDLLDRVRAAANIRSAARVETVNDFPTASGLASSASGFAALALAATRAAGLDWDAARVSDLARRSSASAARSLFGGIVELPAGTVEPQPNVQLAAHPVSAPGVENMRVVVCVTSEAAKEHGSTDAMRSTAERSRFYGAWLDLAPSIHESLKAAVLGGDWQRVGALAEESALAMHGCALAAGFAYFRDSTLGLIAKVRELRAKNIPIFFTVDAGPHLKAFVHADSAERASLALSMVPGVKRTRICKPGPGASIVEAK